MMVPSFCLLLLGPLHYELGVTLGRPDTIKLLVSPQKVVERADTIIVLDEEWKDHLMLKRYTLDGFFVSARPYKPERDSGIFLRPPQKPDSGLTQHLGAYVHPEFYSDWEAMALGPDSIAWLAYSAMVADDGGHGLLGLDLTDMTVTAQGWGPWYSDYRIASIRTTPFRFPWPPLYLHVSARYVYLIAGEFLGQYDKKARFVRNVGTNPEASFKEPVGIALQQDEVHVSDFRLGLLWEYCPNYADSLRTYRESEGLAPESPTYLCCSPNRKVWAADVLHRMVLQFWPGGQLQRAFGVETAIGPGGSIFRLAATDSLLVVFEPGYKRVLVYDTTGKHLREVAVPVDEEHKGSALVGMDNETNIYGRVGKRWFRQSPLGTDTTWLDLPAIPLPYDFDWPRCYRVGDTLYVLGNHSCRDKPPTHGVYVFVNDTLTQVLDGDQFKGGLQGWFTDFAVAPNGSFWFVDIGKRIVQEYRPVKQ